MLHISQIDSLNNDRTLKELPSNNYFDLAKKYHESIKSECVNPPSSIAAIDIKRCLLFMAGLGNKKKSYEDGITLLKLLDLKFDISLEEIPLLIKYLAPSKLTIKGIGRSSDFKRGYGWSLHYSELEQRLTVSYLKGGVSSFSRILEVKS